MGVDKLTANVPHGIVGVRLRPAGAAYRRRQAEAGAAALLPRLIQPYSLPRLPPSQAAPSCASFQSTFAFKILNLKRYIESFVIYRIHKTQKVD